MLTKKINIILKYIQCRKAGGKITVKKISINTQKQNKENTFPFIFQIISHIYLYFIYYRRKIIIIVDSSMKTQSSPIDSNQFMKQSNKIEGIKKNLKTKYEMLKQYEQKIADDFKLQSQKLAKQKKLGDTSFRLMNSNQKRVEIYTEDIGNSEWAEEDKIYHCRIKDIHSAEHNFKSTIHPKTIYYPPCCSGYDMAYCKANDSIYIFGGVSCTSELTEGIQQYFFQYHNSQWKQIKPASIYSPMPRYGHTLTCVNNELLLFGGVSEFKEKLRDRCFYADLWAYHPVKNCWRIAQVSGDSIKNRKSHSACIYQKFYIIHGGINDSEDVIQQISWALIEEKKIRWRTKKIEGRFNHKIQIIQNSQGRDYLFVFGGRNKQSEVLSELLVHPIYMHDNQLFIRQPTRISNIITPRQIPIMCSIGTGVIIMGGTDKNNETKQDTWFYDIEKQCLEPIDTKLEWNELRGAKGASLANKSVYILIGSSSRKYKAVEIEKQQ